VQHPHLATTPRKHFTRHNPDRNHHQTAVLRANFLSG
jgi:hypothetical protein